MEKKQSGARGEERRGASWACPGQLREALQVFTSSKVLLCCREKQVRKNPERRYIPNERVRACVRACVRASVNKAVPSRLSACAIYFIHQRSIASDISNRAVCLVFSRRAEHWIKGKMNFRFES